MANNRIITGDIAGIPQPKKQTSAPVVQAIEPIKGDWSQNNNWAFSFDKFKAGWPLANGVYIYSVAQCPVFRGPPRVRGIMLTRDDIFINGGYNTGSLDIKARITFGSGGLSQQIVTDWGPSTVINLPASNITIEAVVTGQNDDGSGQPIMGGILGCSFSNELIPKVGFTTLSDPLFYLNVPKEIPTLATGFIIGYRGSVADTEILNAYSTDTTTSAPVCQYLEAFTDSNLGIVNWLPTKASWLIGSGSTDPVSITWVLSV